MLTLRQLIDVKVWTQMEDSPLEYRLASCYRKELDLAWVGVTPVLLQTFLSPAGSVANNNIDVALRDAFLERLHADGIIKGPPWALTEKGHQLIEIGYRVRYAGAALNRHVGDLSEASVDQLIRELDVQGWAHRVVKQRDTRAWRVDSPYKFGVEPPSPKVWYTVANTVGVLRLYLLALLRVGTGQLPVIHHFEDES